MLRAVQGGHHGSGIATLAAHYSLQHGVQAAWDYT
jgi:hypothetical protein